MSVETTQRVTLYDVCRHTGLSTATVSRVINASPRVRAATRERVEEAIRELGFVPSHAARTLARQKQETLGVIFPEIDSGFYTEVLRGIDEVAAEHGYHLMTAFSHGQRRDERDLVTRFLLEGRVDGLILMNLVLPPAFVREAAMWGTPLVLIDRPVEGSDLFAVTIDNVDGADEAMTHLIEHHDYRRVALLTGPVDNFDSQQRLEGCQRAAKRLGVSIDDDLVWTGGFTESSGARIMRAWLKSGREMPEAIFAFNDAMAIGAMEVLREAGRSVPLDVAMIGFDDIASARHLGLTSVHVPMRRMGELAARVALEQLGRIPAQPREPLHARLELRLSCGCKPGNGSLL